MPAIDVQLSALMLGLIIVNCNCQVCCHVTSRNIWAYPKTNMLNYAILLMLPHRIKFIVLNVAKVNIYFGL